MKLQLKAVANEYFMNNNCIYVILSRQPTNWSPVHYYPVSLQSTRIQILYVYIQF